MSLLVIAGWFLIGALVATFLVKFWDDVKNWLNVTAANAVGKALGYNAREKMHKAVVRVDRVMDKLRNRSEIYTKRNTFDAYYDKTTMVAEVDSYEIDSDVLNEVNKQKEIVESFGYTR